MKRFLVLGADKGRLILIAALAAASLLIGSLAIASVAAEWNADRSHPDASRTFRVTARPQGMIDTAFTSLTPRDLGAQLDGSNLLVATTVVPLETGIRATRDTRIVSLRVLFVDAQFPQVFDYGVSPADLQRLETAGGILLTDAAARRLAVRAGDELIVAEEPRVFAGTLTKSSSRSHLEFDAIAPVAQLEATAPPAGGDGSALVLAAADATTYVITAPEALGAAQAAAEASLLDLEGYAQDARLEPLVGLRAASAKAGDPPSSIVQSDRLQEVVAASGIALVALIGAACSIPLLFAAVVERQRRVLGLLGSLGSSRAKLTRRFAFETASVLGFGAAAAGLGFALTVGLGGESGMLSDIGAPGLIGAGVFGVVTLAATMAMTLGLSWRRLHSTPIDLLEKRGDRAGDSKLVLATLAIQAALSFAVIGSAGFIYDQIREATTAGQGFSDVWSVEMTNPAGAQDIVARLEDSPLVEHVAVSAWRPYGVLGSTFDVRVPGRLGQQATSSILVARSDLRPILDQTLVAGRDLEGLSALPCRILVNEELASRLSLKPGDAVDHHVEVDGIAGATDCAIQGVVANQRFDTGRAALTPAVHMLAGPAYPNYRDNYLLIRAVPGVDALRMREAIGASDDILDPVQLRSIAEEAYRVERNLFRSLTVCALVLLFIALATLGSNIALTIETRTVEIGVRRALGHRWSEILIAVARPSITALCVGTLGGLLLSIGLMIKWTQAFDQAPVFGAAQLLAPILCIMGVGLAALAVNWLRLRAISPADVLRA